MSLERGFTLIELLVTIGIIGVLAAVAIPHYAQYRQSAYDSSAESTLRNILTAQESYYVDNEVYSTVVADLPAVGNLNPGISVSLVTAGETWSGSSYHSLGVLTFCYDSSSDSAIRSVSGSGASCS